MQALCEFLVKKTELRKPDYDRPYPYEKDLRFVAAWEKGCAPWQKPPQTTATNTEQLHTTIPFGGVVPVPGIVPGWGVPFATIPPVVLQANQFMFEIPVWTVRQWYRDVTNHMMTVSLVLAFWLIWYSTKRAYVIMICPSCIVVVRCRHHPASALWASVHSPPSNRIQDRNFIFSMNMHMCPQYMHIKYLVILTCIFSTAESGQLCYTNRCGVVVIGIVGGVVNFLNFDLTIGCLPLI